MRTVTSKVIDRLQFKKLDWDDIPLSLETNAKFLVEQSAQVHASIFLSNERGNNFVGSEPLRSSDT